jgi:hypothetical protein
MARYSIAGRSTIAGTNVLPQFSLWATATINFRIREIGVFNTTVTAVNIALSRLTARGTVGSAITVNQMDSSSVAASCTPFNGNTVAATVGTTIVQTTLGAAAGAGMIWTFANDTGINTNAGTTNGVGIIVPNGTGQITDFYLIWDE